MSFIAGRRFILVCLALLFVVPPSFAADVPKHEPHVRTNDPALAGLFRQALAASASIRALAARLDDSDVVVYLKSDPRMSPQLEGQMTFVGAGGGRRYVVVALAWGRPALRAIATLGHELQHAVEVAERPDIVSSATLADGYEQFGEETRIAARVRSYETAAAVEAGRRVWAELCRRGK